MPWSGGFEKTPPTLRRSYHPVHEPLHARFGGPPPTRLVLRLNRGRALVARCSSPRRRNLPALPPLDHVLLTTFLGLHLGHDDRDVVRVETGPHGRVRHQRQEVEGGGSGHRR